MRFLNYQLSRVHGVLGLSLLLGHQIAIRGFDLRGGLRRAKVVSN